MLLSHNDQQQTSTHDVIVGKDLRNGVHEVQNEPDQRVDEAEYSRETREAVATIEHRQVNDKCKQTRHLQMSEVQCEQY